MKLQKLFFAAVIVLSANAALAQDGKIASHSVNISIPEIALLDLEDGTSAQDGSQQTVGQITLVGEMPVEAGDKMTFGDLATNNDIWMNYSSIVSGTSSRNVSVKISSGAVPTGLKLTVEAGAATTGAGTWGGVTGALTLVDENQAAQDIVETIGSVYTESGKDKGHNLTYKLNLADDTTTYGSLRFDTTTALVITYTLSDI
jgi:hypothetical protein